MKKKCIYPSNAGNFFKILRKIKLSFFLLCLFTIPVIASSNADGNKKPAQATLLAIQKKGKVIDSENKNGLPGVNVVIKGTQVGTITDVNGEFTIDVPDENATLTFSFIGYISQDILVKGLSYINVILVPGQNELEGVVVVGYGTAKKVTLTGAISNIKSDAISSTTHASLAQNLEGKLSGLAIRQNSGEPGQFDQLINVRGFGTPLFVVDGVVRGSATDFQKLNPEDIESISVLKDASAAIYGMNANNGVIIVTTKKGAQGKAKFHYNNVVGMQYPTNVVKMSNASQYYDIFIDSKINMGNPPPITAAELEKYHDGTYPSTDWISTSFNKYAVLQNHTFSAEGGNDVVSYYTSFGYMDEGSILKTKDMYYKKYSLISNFTAKLTKNLVAQIDISGLMDERYQPNGDWFWLFRGTTVSLPTDTPYANNNPNYLDRVKNDSNPFAMENASITGYKSNKNKAFTSTVSLTYTVPFIKGLKIKGLAAYDSNDNLVKALRKSYKAYSYDATTDAYTPVLFQSPSNISNSYTDYNYLTFQTQMIYNRSFADVHNVSATLVFEQKQSFSRTASLSRDYDFYANDQINQASTGNQQNSGSESQTANQSYIGRFTYDYKSKYLAEFACRYDGSYRYDPSVRWGFFPVISAGWRLSEEDFIKDNIPFLSNLKIRASYGQIGQDAGNPFQYLLAYSTSGGGGYEFTNGTWTTGAASPALINKELTWSTSKTADIGIEFGFFRNKIIGEFDVYQRNREGILSTRAISLPNTFGATLPQENLNGDRVRGFDFSLEHNNNIGNVYYSVKGNLSFSRTMNLYVERAAFTSQWDEWKNRTAYRYNDYVWGYTAIGQFQSLDEVVQYCPQNGTNGNLKELPGDYKFLDVNGDGAINGSDQLPYAWNGTPKLFYGLTLTASWKGFDFNALLQGQALNTIKFSEVYGEVLAFFSNTPAYFSDRWHKADPYDPNSAWVPGNYPPSKVITDEGSFFKESTNWRYNATYLRFKNVEIGYTFPQALIKKVRLENLRVYFNASNIFTICDKFVKQFDPEKIEGLYNDGFNYPLMRTFNLGINVTF